MFLIGAFCGAVVAVVFALLGVSIHWAIYPTMFVTMAELLGYPLLSLTWLPSQTTARDNDIGRAHASSFTPRFILVAGCSSVVYGAVVSLLAVTNVAPREPYYEDTFNIASLLNRPPLLFVEPLAALTLLVVLEAVMRRVFSFQQLTLSEQPALLRRALQQWLGERLGVLAMVEGELPLLIVIGVSDLLQPFAFPFSDVFSGLAMALAVASMLLGFAVCFQYTRGVDSERQHANA